MSDLRVIIAGGGTGGHIFPAVAVGHALQRLNPNMQLLFVGAKDRMEMEKVPQEGFEIRGLDIAGFNRSNIWKNLSLPLKLLKSRMQAMSILKEFRPHVIVGVGGYASFPILNAGQGLHIPTLIQEQNSFAGKSNKILGRRAKAVCVAYEHMDQFFAKEKIIITGNPVRKSITDMCRTSREGKEWFELKEDKTTILIVGGSQGARSINETVDMLLSELMREDVQVIWQTGKGNYEAAQRWATEYDGRVKVYDFIKDMDYAYAAADLVVSRAGALAIAELCIAGKPVIFVPLPSAAEDHQTSNAMALVKRNAALLVKDRETKTDLLPKIKQVLRDKDMQSRMSVQLLAMAIKDADERIAKKVMELAETRV
jgi:UDP-N-acetylglucosamine--N-acetylmuramyl-(pentapeptide) pyrophosphoryl-undecaprenol N-acetylglucosamine transferase